MSIRFDRIFGQTDGRGSAGEIWLGVRECEADGVAHVCCDAARWVVERTIGWMNNFRALSKHYERDSEMGEAKMFLVSIFDLSKRLTHQETRMEINLIMEEKLR